MRFISGLYFILFFCYDLTGVQCICKADIYIYLYISHTKQCWHTIPTALISQESQIARITEVGRCLQRSTIYKKLTENMCTQTHLKKPENPKGTIVLVMPVNLNQHECAWNSSKAQIHFLEIQLRWKIFSSCQQRSEFKGKTVSLLTPTSHKVNSYFWSSEKFTKKITRINVGCQSTGSWKTSRGRNSWSKYEHLLNILTMRESAMNSTNGEALYWSSLHACKRYVPIKRKDTSVYHNNNKKEGEGDQYLHQKESTKI